MLFKNVHYYGLGEKIELSPEDLAKKLAEDAFRPCGKMQMSSFGWAPPLGRFGEELVHAANGCIMIAAKLEEKVLPAAVINDIADEKITYVEQTESRELSNREKKDIKNEVRESLIPKAFTKSSVIFAYIDIMKQCIVVNASSTKKAEEVVMLLRNSLGSLKAIPAATNDGAASCMSSWLIDKEAPEDFVMSNECEMRDTDDGRGVIKCTNQVVTDEEIVAHLVSGMRVSRLGLNWDDRLAFRLGADLTFKGIKFIGINKENMSEIDADSYAEMFDATFAIMTLEFREFFPVIFGKLGGLVDVLSSKESEQ